jgi:hypothetical protein
MESDSSAGGIATPSHNRHQGRFEPTDANAPIFDGRNITEFLEEYNFECDRVCWNEETRKLQLPYFCTQRYKAFVRKLPSYYNKEVSWESYQKELSSLYADQDENRKRGTRAFIESYVSEVHRKQPTVKITEYYQNFLTYFAAAKCRNQVTEAEKGHFFFRGLAREDMDRVMHLMPKEDRPKLDDLSSFKPEKIYEFVREHQEQEEGLNALNTDYSSVSRILARKDADNLDEPFLQPEPKYYGKAMPGMIPIQQQAKVVVPKVDPGVEDLIKRFDGLTLSVEQFEYLANSNLSLRRLLSKGENYAEAYKRLVLRPHRVEPPILERNDGSFQSSYPPIMNPQVNNAGFTSREPPRQCRACGREGHVIMRCPDMNLLKENMWYHTRTEKTSEGWNQVKYYFGPYPNELWGIFPRGGFAPKAFGSEVLEWVLQSLKERFRVTDYQLKQPIRAVLPTWFDEAGRPLPMKESDQSGESYTIEASENGELLAKQTMALRSAAKFLESVSQTGEVLNAEPSVNAAGQRGRPPKKAVEQHRKDVRPLSKKSSMPAMKSSQASRARALSEEFEEEPELLRYQAVVDMQDAAAEEAQAQSSLDPEPNWSHSTRSATIEREVVPAPVPREARKTQAAAVPSPEGLVEMARNTSAAVIVKAMLNQEVRGIRQLDLLNTPDLAAVFSKVIEEARKPKVRFQDSEHRSGEAMTVVTSPEEGELSLDDSLQQIFEWGSGETFVVESDQDVPEVITSKTLRQLCPRAVRSQQVQQP